MPSLGADMEAGILVEWLKRPGDHIRHGDIIAVVETQKGAIEVEIFEDGVVDRLLVEPGAKVPVGTPLALIAGEIARAAVLAPPAATRVTPSAPEPVRVPPSPAAASGRVSPAARRLARERGIDLARLHGTGPGGAVISADVERGSAVRPRRGIDLAAMRQAIAAAMTRSKREIPHYYLNHSIEIGVASAHLERRNAERPPEERLLLTALLLKAVARALEKLPEFNGFFVDGRFQPSKAIHVGIGIALRGGGLIAPALRDIDRRSADEIMSAIRDLVGRARVGQLRSSELSDATITVSSLGDRGVDGLYGVIYPPQVALVGFGTPSERPWIVNGAVVTRPVLTATLAADHRVSDGHRGALLLAAIAQHLQSPESL